jgi:exportin-2 (importin alpha re-exporter)
LAPALLTARWRSQFRTDRLYSEINFVLSRFCQPFYELFGHVDRLLSTPASEPLPPNANIQLLAQALLLLTELFHDLNSQDLPPFFEEHLDDFMGNEASGKEGWLRKYLSWERPELKGDVSSGRGVCADNQDDDDVPGSLEKIRASICEIAELYALKYSEEFKQLGSFVNGVWTMLTTVGPSGKEDLVRRFLVKHS